MTSMKFLEILYIIMKLGSFQSPLPTQSICHLYMAPECYNIDLICRYFA